MLIRGLSKNGQSLRVFHLGKLGAFRLGLTAGTLGGEYCPWPRCQIWLFHLRKLQREREGAKIGDVIRNG